MTAKFPRLSLPSAKLQEKINVSFELTDGSTNFLVST